MPGLFGSEYRFSAVSPDGIISIGPAEKKDAEALASMYREVHISKNNHTLRFDPVSSENFSHTGGMFNALDKTNITEILDDNDSGIVISKLDDEIIGMLWVSRTDPAFSGYIPEDEKLKPAADSGKVLYFRDIIVSGTARVKKLPSMLIYAALRLGSQIGCTHSLAEIYRIMYYNDGIRKEVGLLNNRSVNAAISSGGCPAGELPLKSVWIDGIEVGILSSIFMFDYAYTEEILTQKMSSLGIKFEGTGL